VCRAKALPHSTPKTFAQACSVASSLATTTTHNRQRDRETDTRTDISTHTHRIGVKSEGVATQHAKNLRTGLQRRILPRRHHHLTHTLHRGLEESERALFVGVEVKIKGEQQAGQRGGVGLARLVLPGEKGGVKEMERGSVRERGKRERDRER
jgi:hypothetical protein